MKNTATSLHVNESSIHDGGLETNKVIKFLWKEQINEFIKVKLVIISSICVQKVIFIFFYVKDINKSVP